ncbi:MAG: HAD-IC family P-type ATPase, partial [Clostridia bacterium]|nr:HAD-IC family P-type ATPase [Clostridia bacterium]
MQTYKGLTQEEAEKRLAQNGRNVLKEEKPKSVFQMFLEQILNFTNAILAAAIIISIILGDYGEAIIMLVIVIANAIIGVVQEGKAQKALDALKKMSVLKATVIRDGETREISSEELVVGDIVVLEAGKQVPADLKVLEDARLMIDEKALTGESVPVEKDHRFVPDEKTGIGDRLDLAYMSTIVTYGRGVGVVEHTGMDTQIGKIADMVGKEKDKPSPLQKGMDELSKVLGIGVIVICAIVFLIGFLQGREVLELLMTAVSLAVAAIPEGIPTIVTIVLALGMQRMAKVNAIVKNMPAVETLGAVSYVCSDKTGTLTQNKMTV